MNLFASAPLWLAWCLAALLIAAAIEDAVRMKISNVVSLAVFVAAIVAMAVGGLEIALWQNALVFAVLLAGGTLLFGAGKMGGGDVKLMAGVGLWCSLTTAFTLLPIVFITGGLLALIILAARTIAPKGSGVRVIVLKPGSGIPYGIAIAAGALITLALSRG
ncbi:prepilin peptidase [Sphingomonas sp.]|uniref:A24 family peptidase n=1 Tax=Sphingomonas sp. TaxID=28214 RepID=UPI0017A33FF6|nr:prepilin peptidase [Sphingomonas sp.]MBA3511805.1 prepilin peptidase [Sphingomonas sp.]